MVWTKDNFENSTLSTKYSFKPYELEYINLFECELARLKPHFSSQTMIEHVGSTAVPGLGGKGIVDILIAVPEQEMQIASSILISIGYQFAPDSGSDKRKFHHAKVEHADFGSRNFHIHLTDPNNEEFHKMIAFRDYLRSHPDEANKYAEIKKLAALEATKYSDKKEAREKYLSIKGPLIETMITKHLKERV